MATMTVVNDFCRLCKANCRVDGTIKNTKQIWGGSSEIYERLSKLGVILQRSGGKSCRICMVCVRRIQRIEDSFATVEQWKRDEALAPEEMAIKLVLQKEKRERPTPTMESEAPREYVLQKEKRGRPTSTMKTPRNTKVLRQLLPALSGPPRQTVAEVSWIAS